MPILFTKEGSKHLSLLSSPSSFPQTLNCVLMSLTTQKNSPLNWEERSRIIKKVASFHFHTVSGKLMLWEEFLTIEDCEMHMINNCVIFSNYSLRGAERRKKCNLLVHILTWGGRDEVTFSYLSIPLVPWKALNASCLQTDVFMCWESAVIRGEGITRMKKYSSSLKATGIFFT